jgi:class 3 adenylate cyclase/tetratricopeptide (TPR) repeat protein
MLIACRQCGRDFGPADRFCSNCGAPRPREGAEVEKKVVTMLFVDIVNSSDWVDRLSPEVAQQMVQEFHERVFMCVKRYGGEVNHPEGDGAMALFGAPKAHEQHEVRALRAALAIRDDLQEFDREVRHSQGVRCQVRMGLNTGAVVAGPIGNQSLQAYTAIGAPVHLTRRLQQAAPPGAIWVSEATRQRDEGLFSWEQLEVGMARGLKDRFVYALLERRNQLGGKFDALGGRTLTPLVGRDHELRQLEAAWATARRGSGRVVAVVGEAGLGKTRLLHEFRRTVDLSAATVSEGSCVDHGDPTPYLPFRELLKGLFHLHDAESESEAVRRVGEEVRRLGLSLSDESAILNVLSYPVEDRAFRALTANFLNERTVRALRSVIKETARRQPLVLVIEDLHWIDEATGEVVISLIRDLESQSLLVVLALRPEETRPAPAGQASIFQKIREELEKTSLATTIQLDRVSPEQSSQMVRHILGTPSLPADIEQRLLQMTDGYPLFVEEIVLSLVQRRALTQRGEQWLLEAPDEPSLRTPPEALTTMFQARVDRLDDDLKEIVRVASVMGRVFTASMLDKASGRISDIESALNKLAELELVYPQPAAAAGTYAFKHAMCQRAVYDSIVGPSLQQFHERVGRAIEDLHHDRRQEHCELLAHHFRKSVNLHESAERLKKLAPSSPEYGEELKRLQRVLGYLRQANGKAIGMSAMTGAQAYFKGALEVLKALPENDSTSLLKFDLVLEQVFVTLALFTFRDYYKTLEEHEATARRLGDARRKGAFAARVGWCEWAQGDFEKGIVTLNQAVEDCRSANNDDDLGFALMTRAWCELDLGDFRPALLTCVNAIDALERKPDLQSYVRTRAAAAAVHAYLGNWKAAIAEGRQAVERSREYDASGATSFAAMIGTWPYVFMGDMRGALEMAELARATALDFADQLFAKGNHALVRCRFGGKSEATEAAKDLAEVVGVIHYMQFPACETFDLYYCEALWRSGDLERARSALDTCLTIVGKSNMKYYQACAWRLIGEVALAEGRAQRDLARQSFQKSAAGFKAVGAENDYALALAGWGRQRIADADRAGAEGHLREALAIFERLGTLREPDVVRGILAQRA